MGVLAFLKVGDVADGRSEAGRGRRLGLALAACLQLIGLEVLDALKRLLLHVARHLGRQDQARLLAAGDATAGRVGAELVGGPALVCARVLAVAVEDVEDDDAKVVEGSEPVASGQWLAVLEPLNLEGYT